jgi:hypothetical protein
MVTPKTKSELSLARRCLVELMQEVNFGQIENLLIRAGEPTFDPRPRVVREIKLCAAENGPRPERAAGDFRLKEQLVELFQRLDALGDATIECLEIKHGLPFRLFHVEPSG